MAKSFKELRAGMSAEAVRQSEEKSDEMLLSMPLNELRAAKKLSQESMAQLLNKKQANISRLEKNTDMYISTLKSYIEAMGGTLDIVASFPDGRVSINQFHSI
jgi:DNA-binding XRE family transcriptional regulator